MKKITSLFYSAVMFAFTVSLCATVGLPLLGTLALAAALTAVAYVATSGLPPGIALVACAGIDAGMDIDCTTPIQAGTDDRLFLVNRADITVTRDTTNPYLITAITLAAGKKAYLWAGQLGSLRPKWALVKQGYTRVYDHFVDFLGFMPTVGKKQVLGKLPTSNMVAIIIQNYDGDPTKQSKIEIFGLDAGLAVQAMERDYASTTTQSAVDIKLQTDISKESRMPCNYYHTDYATSISEIVALTT